MRPVAEPWKIKTIESRDEVPGLSMVYEPPTLRFFMARFEPLSVLVEV